MMDQEADRQMSARVLRLHRHWRWVILGSGGCALLALVVSLFLPKIYRATTYILVSESKIGNGSSDSAWQQMAMLPTFIPFVDNDALVSQTLRKFHLDQPPYSLNPDRFRRHYLDVSIPKSARLLKLEVEFPNARMAADLANALAAGAASFNSRINANDAQSTEQFLRSQLDRANQRLRLATANQLKIQQDARLEEREKLLSRLLESKDELANKLQTLGINLAEEESQQKSLKDALAAQPEFFKLKKSVTSDRFLEKANEQLNPGSQALSMTEESVNPTREEIQRELVEVTARVSAGKAGIDATSARVALINARLSPLLEQVTQSRSELEAAKREYDLAGDAVKDASAEYQNASVRVNSKSEELKQIAPALVPERPVRPRILLNTIMGFLFGLILLGMVAAAIESWRDMKGQSSRPAETDVRLSLIGR